MASLLYQYAITLVSNPWEVGKILMQVQWVPRDADATIPLNAVYSDEEEEVRHGSFGFEYLMNADVLCSYSLTMTITQTHILQTRMTYLHLGVHFDKQTSTGMS